MKFIIGTGLGFAAGYWVATTSGEERRAKVDEALGRIRDDPRIQRVTETVSRDAKRIGDAVEKRIVHTADRSSETVAAAVEPGAESEGSGTGAAGGSSKDRSKSA
jgi:hypothetical protein